MRETQEITKMRTALITGITGQDGQYLAEFLIAKGYKVYGMVRGQHNPKQELVAQQIPALEFVDGDLLDQSSLMAALEITQPDEVYNLGAISFVPLSWKQPVLTCEITGLGAVRMLEAIRQTNTRIRYYQASSSGDVRQSARGAADRAYGLLATVAVWLREGDGALCHDQSPRELRDVCRERHPVQP